MPGTPAAGTGGELLVIGANHRTSPLAWRDRLALVEADLAGELERLRDRGLRKGVLLATCERVELVTVAGNAAALQAEFAAYLAERLGESPDRVGAVLYLHRGTGAAAHLFSVASALDSLVIGEPQVLGQLRAAHRAAGEAGLVSGVLEAAFQAAYAVARRVRRETGIAERPVSMAAAAVELAREIHGDLDRGTVLLLGTGEIGELMAEHFRRVGVRQLLVSGESAASEALAHRLGSTLLPSAALEEGLHEADIVIASVGSGRRVLTTEMVAAALRRRRQPMFVIDAGIPLDVEPAVNDLDGAFLYTLDDLERAAMAGRAGRQAAVEEARAIVAAELGEFERRQAERAAVPAVTALRAHFEALRGAVLREQPGLDAEAATRLLVNRLLHAPSETLRGLAATEGDAAAAEALLRRLFRLESEEGDRDP